MRPLEEALVAELRMLLHAGVTPQAVRWTVREVVVARLIAEPSAMHDVRTTAGAVARVACRLVRETGTSADIVEAVCRATLETIRGQGGSSARWLDDAGRAVLEALDELARERPDEAEWRWLMSRIERW